MTQAAVLVPSLTEGDAVGNDVLGMARGLKSRGCDVGIFAIHGEVPGVEVRPVDRVHTWLTDPAGVAIYHSSTSWPDGLEALIGTRARRVIKYHNVTGSEEHTSELQSHSDLVCRLLLEKKKKNVYSEQLM